MIDAKQAVNDLAEAAVSHVAERLIAEAPRRTETFQIENDLIEQLKRVYYLSKRIAKLLLQTDVPEEQQEPATVQPG